MGINGTSLKLEFITRKLVPPHPFRVDGTTDDPKGLEEGRSLDLVLLVFLSRFGRGDLHEPRSSAKLNGITSGGDLHWTLRTRAELV